MRLEEQTALRGATPSAAPPAPEPAPAPSVTADYVEAPEPPSSPPPPSPRPAGEPQPGVEEQIIAQIEVATSDRVDEIAEEGDEEEDEPRQPPHTGHFAEIARRLELGETNQALAQAKDWIRAEPANVLALVALGNVHEAAGDASRAARAYGSLIDLFPSRADLRRFAGELLGRLAANHADESVRALAIDTYRRALQLRPDHPSSHRQLAWALAAAGRHGEAFAVIEAALKLGFREDRFESIGRILREELGILATAWLNQADERDRPTAAKAAAIRARLRRLGTVVAGSPSLRFVLTWETDANDVDLHLWDARGDHASYESMRLPSGGELFDDITTGYGPECFAIAGRPKAAPYRVEAHYYNRGAMGFGLGTLHILEHDGKGGLRMDHRPFVIMVDDGWVDLGTWPPKP